MEDRRALGRSQLRRLLDRAGGLVVDLSPAERLRWPGRQDRAGGARQPPHRHVLGPRVARPDRARRVVPDGGRRRPRPRRRGRPGGPTLGTTSDNIRRSRSSPPTARRSRATGARTRTSTGPAAAVAAATSASSPASRSRTHAVRTASYFFASFDWDDVGDVVARWQRWAPNAPPELFSLCSLGTGRAGPVLNVFGQYMGSSGRAAPRARRRSPRPPSRAACRSAARSTCDLILRWAGCLSESPAECRVPPYAPFKAKSSYVLSPIRRGASRRWRAGSSAARRQSSQGWARSSSTPTAADRRRIRRSDGLRAPERPLLAPALRVLEQGVPRAAGRTCVDLAASTRRFAPYVSRSRTRTTSTPP